MSNKLNDEYFKTREKHKKNSAGKTKYVFWVILCIVAYFIYSFFLNNDNTKLENVISKEEQINEHKTILSENRLFLSDSIITLKQGGYKLKILKGYSFTFLKEKGPLLVASNDSSGANIIIHFLEDNVYLKDYIENFNNKSPSYNATSEILRKDYKDENYMEKCEVTFTKNNIEYYGSIYLIKKDNECLIIQGTSDIQFWKFKNIEIYDMIDSFFTLNKKKSNKYSNSVSELLN